MRAILFPGEGVAELTAMDIPIPQPDEVLIQLEWSGICATDLHYSDQSRRLRRDATWPAGHEGVGTIHGVGSGVPVERIGERVVCYAFLGCGNCASCLMGDPLHCENERVLGRTTGGTFAEYVAIPSWCAQPLPDSLWQPEAAALGCAAPTGFAAVNRFIDPGSQVLVTGLGPVGMFAFAFAALAGSSVTAVDPSPRRVAAAQRLNLGRVGTSIESVELHGSKSIDGVIECSGSAAALDTAMEVLAPRGRLIVVGTGAEIRVSGRELIDRELAIFGSLFYRPREWTSMIELITGSSFDLGAIRGLIFPPDQMSEALTQARTQTLGKIVIGWGTDSTD